MAYSPIISANDIISHLNLEPLPGEGGFFRQTYKTAIRIDREQLPDGFKDGRNLCTAIYYLMTPDDFSSMHRVRSDEMWHFYFGDAVEQLQLRPDGNGEMVRIGTNILSGENVQVLVPAGVWQGARLKPGGRFALLGMTVAPGFEYTDYEQGTAEPLISSYPKFAGLIRELTRG